MRCIRSSTVVVFALVVGFVSLIAWRIGDGKVRQEQRAELHALNTLGALLTAHLGSGQSLPSDWGAMTNISDWKLLDDICEQGKIVPIQSSYFILTNRLIHRDHRTVEVFLVRLFPSSQPAGDTGRWALAVSSNRVVRLWLPEDRLDSELHLQLKRQGKKSETGP
jgi:hypothetical protein